MIDRQAVQRARSRYGVDGPKRSAAVGRVYALAGGAANQPTSIFAADAAWFTPTERNDGWASSTRMTPQTVSFDRGHFAVADHQDAQRWIEDDLETYRAAVPNRRKVAPVIICVETSQSPAVYEHFLRIGRETQDDAIRVVGYRLRPGDQSATVSQQTGDFGVNDVGAVWLSSWFNGTVAREIPTEQLHGRPYAPGRIVSSFSDFSEEDAPGMKRSNVLKALTAAEALIAKRARSTDTEALLDLSGDEVTAASIMLSVLAIETITPPSARYREGPWGYNRYAPVRSTYRGAV